MLAYTAVTENTTSRSMDIECQANPAELVRYSEDDCSLVWRIPSLRARSFRSLKLPDWVSPAEDRGSSPPLRSIRHGDPLGGAVVSQENPRVSESNANFENFFEGFGCEFLVSTYFTFNQWLARNFGYVSGFDSSSRLDGGWSGDLLASGTVGAPVWPVKAREAPPTDQLSADIEQRRSKQLKRLVDQKI